MNYVFFKDAGKYVITAFALSGETLHAQNLVHLNCSFQYNKSYFKLSNFNRLLYLKMKI